MKKSTIYLGFSIFTLIVGLLSGRLSAAGLQRTQPLLEKIPLMPPFILFPIVWSILYLLMGISGAYVWIKKQNNPNTPRTVALFLWQLQLLVNFCWSLLFFELNLFLFSFLWLLLLIVLVIAFILVTKPFAPFAAWLQLPYLLWITFAGYLNFQAWILAL